MTALDISLVNGHTGCASYLMSCHAPSGGGVYHRAAATIQAVWRYYRYKVHSCCCCCCCERQTTFSVEEGPHYFGQPRFFNAACGGGCTGRRSNEFSKLVSQLTTELPASSSAGGDTSSQRGDATRTRTLDSRLSCSRSG